MKRIIVLLLSLGMFGCLESAALKERSRGNAKRSGKNAKPSGKMALLYGALRTATPLPEALIEITADYHGGDFPLFLERTQEFVLKKKVSCLAFMGNRGLVVGSSSNNKLEFFDLETGLSTQVKCEQSGQVTAVAHVSGFDIATGSKGTWGGLGALRVWCVKTGEMKANFDGNDDWDRHVSSLAVTNNLLFAACYTQSCLSSIVRTYDLRKRECNGAYQFGFPNNLPCFLPKHDDFVVMGFSDGAICFFDKKQLKIVEQMSGITTPIASLAEASKRQLVVADEGGKVYFMEQQKKSSERPVLKHYEQWETKEPAIQKEIPSRYPIKHVMTINNRVVGIQAARNRNIVCEYSQEPFQFLPVGNKKISIPGQVTKTAVSARGNVCAVVAQESHDALIGKDLVSTVHVFRAKEKHEPFDDEYAEWVAGQQEQPASCVVS